MSVYINSEDAAGILGVKTAIRANKILRDRGVVNQTVSASADRLNSYLSDDVVRVAFDRRREALARHRNDPVTFAREIIRELRPPGPATVKLTDGRTVPRDTSFSVADLAKLKGHQPDPLTMLSPDANMVFGPGVLKASAAKLKPGTCRYCVAHVETPWGGIGPDLSEACRVLLGQPCLRCRVDLTPVKRPATRTARAAPARPSPGRTAGGGPNTPVYWRSQAENALKLADQARDSGDHAASRRLRDRAAEYARRAGS